MPGETTPKSTKSVITLRRIIGTLAVVIAAPCATLMLVLVQALGWSETIAVRVAVTAHAGCVAYTVQKFFRGHLKCHTYGNDEEM